MKPALFGTLLSLLLLPFHASAGPPPVAAESAPAVTVEQSPYGDADIYYTAEGDCTITWTVYTTELNRGVVHHRARCPLPLARQLQLAARIFEELIARDLEGASFHTFFWGGLVPDTKPSSLEMSLRLALAAHRSPGWDRKRGRPVEGHANRFVKDLMDRERIYTELRELFASFGRGISVASVEKVRVLEAGTLPFFDELRAAGVPPKDRLPFDGLVWFSITKEGRGDSE